MWGPQSVMFTLSATCMGLAASPFVGVRSEPQTPSRPSEIPAYPGGSHLPAVRKWGTQSSSISRKCPDPGHGVEPVLSAVEF